MKCKFIRVSCIQGTYPLGFKSFHPSSNLWDVVIRVLVLSRYNLQSCMIESCSFLGTPDSGRTMSLEGGGISRFGWHTSSGLWLGMYRVKESHHRHGKSFPTILKQYIHYICHWTIQESMNGKVKVTLITICFGKIRHKIIREQKPPEISVIRLTTLDSMSTILEGVVQGFTRIVLYSSTPTSW